jgi:long-chain acyl-CoA synthetase
MLLNNLLIEHAHRQSAKAAVITNERIITYGELDLVVNCVARHLVSRGLQRGERVAVHWHNSIEHVVLMMSILRAGMVVVPINPRLKAAEIDFVLEHSGARLCFSEPALAGLVNRVEVMSELPSLKGSCEPLADVDPDAPAIILYTSGTTARPKGVVHSQRSLYEGSRALGSVVEGLDERPLAVSQLAHIAALTCVFIPGLIKGATIVLLRSFEAGTALDMVERFGCTYLFSLPAALQLMAEAQAERPREVSSLRAIGAGGDTLSTSLQRRICEQFHVEAQEGHGMTELCPSAFNPTGAVRSGSVGRPCGTSVRIVDAEGNDLGPGETGELLLQGSAGCIGYWNDPEATAQLYEGGWLSTGDLFSRDEEGYLWFKGRLKQIIIRGGSNISPQEVEEALYQHPAVLEAGVVGLPDPTFGEVPVAFVSLREGRAAAADELIAHVRILLADYKTPERTYFMDELPKGLTGKVDRRRLREILLAQADLVEDEVIARVRAVYGETGDHAQCSQ